MTSLPIERKIRWSASLIFMGLAILFVSLLWSHPLSFMIFLVLGCPLIVAGVLLYLLSLVSKDNASRSAFALIVLMTLPFGISGCGAGSPDSKVGTSSSEEMPAFDPASATVRVFGVAALEAGALPDPPPLTVGEPFCRTNAKKMWEEQALTTKSGGLRNAIVYVRSGFEGRTYKTPSDPVVLDQQGCVYIPHALTIMKGQKLRILNSDATFHNVHAKGENTDVFNIAQAGKGAEDFQVFNRTGVAFRIGCDMHKWMAAYAGVFDHPFHTTSGNTGSYELRLPPGKYEIVAWHEKYGERSAKIDAAAEGPVEWNFKF